MAYDELIFYDQSTDIAYREDQSEIANDNAPEFQYKQVKDIGVRLLDSDQVDGSGDFDDFSDETEATAAILGIDNNFNHFEDGNANAAYSIAGAPYSTVQIKNITELTPRAAGRIKFTNSGGDEETIRYINPVASATAGIYTATCANASYVATPWTPSYDFADDDAARYIENVMIDQQTVDITDKATGLFVGEMDGNNIVIQDLITGLEEIEDCQLEIQLLNSGGERYKIKQLPCRVMNILNDDGEDGPAPVDEYLTAAEIASQYNGIIKHYISGTVDGTSTGDTNIQTIAAGKRFLPLEVIAVLDSISGAGSPPTFKIKMDAVDVMTAFALSMTTAERAETLGLNTDILSAATEIAKVEITVASTYTTYNLKFIVKGIEIDA